ncbi:MAG: hypothetical protein KME42_20525 [Tildeniella nuda ZEHNDER 1965/U140]|jgi:hypothetical protein|nr:hypothetical protein [Tildeniella nuda ZEHNDER 1965/U140]
MNSSVFGKVLLSAVLTSCAVFSVLTLAFLPRQAEPILAESTTGESTEDINHRDVVIRHIGISIVVSVGAGITTAELLRKWRRSRTVVPEGRQILSAQAILQAVNPPDMALAVNGLTASPLSLTDNGEMPTDRLEFQPPAIPALESDRDVDWENTALPLSLFQPLVALPTEDVNWFPLISSNSTLSTASEQMPAVDSSLTSHLLLASREQYQTCRIHRTELPERLFAILFEDQYYRFVKVVSSREQALGIVTRLKQRGEPAVMTHNEERYAVWALVPDACPETPTSSDADSATCLCVSHPAA